MCALAAHCGGSSLSDRDATADNMTLSDVADAYAPVDDSDTAADVNTAVPADLGFHMSAYCMLGATDPLATCAVRLGGSVYDPDTNEPFMDATVTMGPVGSTPTTLSVHSGYYDATQSVEGLATAYHLSIHRGSEDVELACPSPADFTMTTTPSVAIRATALTLMWSPANQTMVAASVGVQSSSGVDWSSGSDVGRNDPGSLTIPASVFASPGYYTITLSRQVTVHPSSTHSGVEDSVSIIRQLTFDVL